ncbi:hypothetical protein FQA39_LY15028 [Lamprigera yunnana]|nr:hypothetical protein FQA39_LY15028 [Lamprigera yunnana]
MCRMADNKEQDGSTELEKKQKKRDKMGWNMKTNIGRDNNTMMVIAEISNWEGKMLIMKNKNKLKGKQVYIDNDLTKEEQKVQAEVRRVAREEKAKRGSERPFFRQKLINHKENRQNTQLMATQAKFMKRSKVQEDKLTKSRFKYQW